MALRHRPTCYKTKGTRDDCTAVQGLVVGLAPTGLCCDVQQGTLTWEYKTGGMVACCREGWEGTGTLSGSKVVSVGLFTLGTPFSGSPTPPMFSKSRQKEKPGAAVCSEQKMLEVGEGPVSDGERTGVSLLRFSKTSETSDL